MRRGFGRTSCLLAAAVLAVTGCSSKLTHIMEPGDFAGPSMRMDSTSVVHVATFTTPSGGWGVRLDHTEEDVGHTNAFVTLTRPDPDQMVTQALVDQSVSLNVALDATVHVYARIVEPGSEAAEATTRRYRRVR